VCARVRACALACVRARARAHARIINISVIDVISMNRDIYRSRIALTHYVRIRFCAIFMREFYFLFYICKIESPSR